jgi:YVTN family beta-propeller protein
MKYLRFALIATQVLLGTVLTIGSLARATGWAAGGAQTTRPVEGKPQHPGQTSEGFLLPNGWTISPAGKQVTLTDLPLNIVPLSDNRYALVATSGFNKHSLSLIDLSAAKVVAEKKVDESWYGLAVSPTQDRIWWSGGGAGMLHTFDLNLAQPNLTASSPNASDLSALSREEQDRIAKERGFNSGLFLDPQGGVLYSLNINHGTISALSPKTCATMKTAACGIRPYDVVMTRNRQLYVSDWAGQAVLVVRPETLRVVARISVGEHPNQMALHPRDDRLFVACASSDYVSVIDTKLGIVSEIVKTALFPKGPKGSTPDALAVAPDGKTLYVANADNNCTAVIDISVPNHSQVKGFIPTGWYPTSVAVTPDGKTLLVGVGKGNQTKPNPLHTVESAKEPSANGQPNAAGQSPPKPSSTYDYIGTLMSGALSIVPVPDDEQLKTYTCQVYRNCPYSDRFLTRASLPGSENTPIPGRVGDPSPIKYVIYILKENRSYDQVFGDIKEGDGDPRLVMFGEKVTPNHHKLAREFVLLDNLYCNAEVSRNGHPWSTMAYATDYIERDWQLTYSNRAGVDDDDDGHLSNAPGGFLWDACARAGLSYYSFGEFGKKASRYEAPDKRDKRVHGLDKDHICPNYGWIEKGVRRRDMDNVTIFKQKYDEFCEAKKMPRFIMMSLGEDHTYGTAVGKPTPRACVAGNDLALGQMVEHVSNGPYWQETAIFVIEDDAQNGPDHVDAHRTVGLMISPYVKRRHVDHSQYSTVSMIRTIELVLGLPPLSQYDAAARPMFASFTNTSDTAPYAHEAAQVDVYEKNTEKAYGAARSNRMDFSDWDLVKESEMNEILWHSIKGVDTPLPPPVRQAIAWRPVVAGK